MERKFGEAGATIPNADSRRKTRPDKSGVHPKVPDLEKMRQHFDELRRVKPLAVELAHHAFPASVTVQDVLRMACGEHLKRRTVAGSLDVFSSGVIVGFHNLVGADIDTAEKEGFEITGRDPNILEQVFTTALAIADNEEAMADLRSIVSKESKTHEIPARKHEAAESDQERLRQLEEAIRRVGLDPDELLEQLKQGELQKKRGPRGTQIGPRH